MAAKGSAGRLYVVATSHLDTQWRWTVRDTIERFLPATVDQNLARFEKYPFYVLSFEGAFRYRLIREYYPERFERVKEKVLAGRWRPAGSMLDAPDVNIVAPESLIRHILYGNRFFERELGTRSHDIFLPDCFGFSWALPSIARHCGLAGFSSQKMMKWAPGRIPFDIGVWEGPDGARLLAALKPGGYGIGLREEDSWLVTKLRRIFKRPSRPRDPSRSPLWIERVRRAGEQSGVAVGYRYCGVGDRGGAMDEESVATLGRALADGGELEIVHTGSDQIFLDLEREEIERLPVHRSELQLPTHGTGCWSAQAQMKRWNRRCETLADAAERAAALAAWLGAAPYPGRTLRRAWESFLWHQMHDDLTGTSAPEAYHLSWNDQLLALNRFATVLTGAVGAVARSLDTEGAGEPLVIYNPLATPRRDPVTARVRFPEPPARVQVLDPAGIEVPSQILGRSDEAIEVVFGADTPAAGLAVYRVLAASADGETVADDDLSFTGRSLENRRYKIAISDAGAVGSIYDKLLERELLAGPIELQLLPDHSRRWPAWELHHKDLMRKPRRWRGGVSIEIEETGPARAALRIVHRDRRTTAVQHIRLYAGDGPAADRIEWLFEIDWRSWWRTLKIAFPLAAENDRAAYDLGLGVIERGINTREAYEVPAQRWAGQTSRDGTWGVTVVTAAGYGWDKPDASTLRHTLLRAPRARHKFRHQKHQDHGHHRFAMTLAGHRGGWAGGGAPELADRVNQPLLAFQTGRHPGTRGRRLSFLEIDAHGLEVRALKRAEEVLAEGGDEWVVRVGETLGTRSRGTVRVGEGIRSAREIDGSERPLGPAEIRGGRLVTGHGPFQPRAWAFRLAPPSVPAQPLEAQLLELDWELPTASFHGHSPAPDFDGRGNALPGELLEREIRCGEVPFRLGPIEPGAANAIVCRGQRLSLPPDADVLYLLAAGIADGDERIVFGSGASHHEVVVHPYSGFIGQKNRWRQYRGWRRGPERPAFLRRSPVAWVGTHRHGPGVVDQAYVFCYLYRLEIPLASGTGAIELPRSQTARIFAATAARVGASSVRLASEIHD